MIWMSLASGYGSRPDYGLKNGRQSEVKGMLEMIK